MSRFAAVLFAAFALPPAAAAPVPRHLMTTPAAAYHPTRPGTTWVYEDGTTLVVSAVEERGDAKVVSVTFDDGRRYHVVELSAARMARTAGVGGPLDPPYVLLRSPVSAGDSWAVEAPDLSGTKTVGGVEAVTVPAGRFQAVRVETDYTSGGRRQKNTAWYAPGVGLVKAVNDGTSTWVLKSFTPGKG